MRALVQKHPDKVIISASMVLMMLGLIFIYSSSGPFCQFLRPPRPTWYFLERQAIWAVVAIVAMFVAYRLDYRAIIKISPVLVVLSLLALIAVFPLSHGAVKRWINLGPFAFQPSEFFKIALVAFMARLAARSLEPVPGLKHYVPTLVIIALGALLIIREPDLGTTTLIMGVAVCLLFLVGFPRKYIAMVGLVFAVIASLLVFGFRYEIDRVEQYGATLRDPFDPGASYQTRQSLVSFGSGGVIGKGLGNGGQKHLFLPARHTDFIISAAAEEGGFVVVALILFLFGMIGWSGFRISRLAIDIEGAFFTWGLMLFILLQVLINMGVALGLFPITGMTLPFLSYGGSSLLVCAVGIGMIASVARRSRLPIHYFKRIRV